MQIIKNILKATPLLPEGQRVRMPVSYYYGGGEWHFCSVILFSQQCANHELVPGAGAGAQVCAWEWHHPHHSTLNCITCPSLVGVHILSELVQICSTL